MNVGAIFGNPFLGVGGAAHDGNLFAAADVIANFQPGPRCRKMGVKRVDLDAFDDVANNDVAPIVGKGGAFIDVGHRAIIGSQNWIGRFVVAVALEASNVEAFVESPAVGTDAAEAARSPRFAGGADNETLIAIGFVERVIRGGKSKRFLSGAGQRGRKDGRKSSREVFHERGLNL